MKEKFPIKRLHTPVDLVIQKVLQYQCPLCGAIYNSEEDVKEHYREEVEWQNMFQGAVVGDKFRIVEDVLDSGQRNNEIHTITKIDWCGYSKTWCGYLLTICTETNKWTADYLYKCVLIKQ